MPEIGYAQAMDLALAQAMAADGRIMVMGEDVRMLRRNLYVRFGGRRVRNTPISEAGFLGAALGAAMAGLKPVAEIMLVDFIAVAVDVLLNHAAKLEEFSGGRWRAPLVVRAACGGGYGDGGQHGQCLWGWLAHIPGLTVAVPSTPADAGGLMLAALEHPGPSVILEHKLLADYWLDYMGGGQPGYGELRCTRGRGQGRCARHLAGVARRPGRGAPTRRRSDHGQPGRGRTPLPGSGRQAGEAWS